MSVIQNWFCLLISNNPTSILLSMGTVYHMTEGMSISFLYFLYNFSFAKKPKTYILFTDYKT